MKNTLIQDFQTHLISDMERTWLRIIFTIMSIVVSFCMFVPYRLIQAVQTIFNDVYGIAYMNMTGIDLALDKSKKKDV